MRSDAHAISQFDAAFEHAAHVDEHIAAASQFAAQIEPGRIRQGHALLQQAARLLALPVAFQLRLLDPAVDPQRLP